MRGMREVAVGAHEKSAAAATRIENERASTVNGHGSQDGDGARRVELTQKDLFLARNQMLENGAENVVG